MCWLAWGGRGRKYQRVWKVNVKVGDVEGASLHATRRNEGGGLCVVMVD